MESINCWMPSQSPRWYLASSQTSLALQPVAWVLSEDLAFGFAVVELAGVAEAPLVMADALGAVVVPKGDAAVEVASGTFAPDLHGVLENGLG